MERNDLPKFFPVYCPKNQTYDNVREDLIEPLKKAHILYDGTQKDVPVMHAEIDMDLFDEIKRALYTNGLATCSKCGILLMFHHPHLGCPTEEELQSLRAFCFVKEIKVPGWAEDVTPYCCYNEEDWVAVANQWMLDPKLWETVRCFRFVAIKGKFGVFTSFGIPPE